MENEYSDKRFLIVDSIKPSRDILKNLAFNLNPESVEATAYPSDVVNMCSENTFDIILLGYDLGDGQKNGQQLLEELRTLGLINRQCIVILVTAETSQAMVLAALEHKPDDYLTKPYNLAELKKRLDRCLYKKKLMKGIYQALDAEQSKQVITLCEQAINDNTPFKTECFGIKSRQHFKLGEFTQAKSIYNAFQATKNCQWATIGLGRIALRDKQLATAKSYFVKLKKSEPFYLPSYDWLATTFEYEKDLISAEKTLAQALKISPYSVPRLKRYAQLCYDNKHFEASTLAFQKNYQLSLSSIHNLAENAFLLAQSFDQYAEELSEYQLKLWKNKVSNALNDTVKSFKSPDNRIKANLHTVNLLNKAKEPFDAKRLLTATEKLLDKFAIEITPQSALSIAKQLFQLDRESPANMLINQVVENNDNDHTLMTEVDKILIETHKDDDHIVAQQALDDALNLYDEKQYKSAQQKLETALQRFPNNVGIKLNLVQVLLTQFEQDSQVSKLNMAGKLLNEASKTSHTHTANSRLHRLETKFKKLRLSAF